MKKNIRESLFSTPASLWDGTSQLSGTLELWATEVVFRPAGFRDSHLNLSIPLAAIEKVEEYLVFNLAKNGLRIQGKKEKYDLFVLDEVRNFKLILLKELEKLK